MRKRRKKVTTKNKELRQIYDNYVNAKESGNEAACLYFAEKAEPFFKDFQYRTPEFANGIMWRKLVKESWRPPAELERLRKEYRQ